MPPHPPPVPQPRPPQPEMPVPTHVLNSLASSVNLSSIQSLVDLLLELPLPRETCLPSQNQPLITVHQEQQHVSNNIEQELVQQHHLSLQLSASLRQARQQLNELNLNWINVPVNEGNIEFSRHQQLNSYLLSLLQQQDIFGEDVKLPPVIHKQPLAVDPFSSLGERVKKRQRNSVSVAPVNVPSPSVQNDSKPSPEDLPSPPAPKKPPPRQPSSSSCPSPAVMASSPAVKTPSPAVKVLSPALKSSSAVKASNSSSLSSSKRLLSSRSTAPPLEQFESMLDDLFESDSSCRRLTAPESYESDEEGSDTDTRKKSKKTPKKAQLLDISISPNDLIDFVCLAAKLKRTNMLKNIPVDKLGKLLNVLSQQLTIQTSGLTNRRRRSSDAAEGCEDDEEEESVANSTTLMSKFEMCCDCCLLALYIMTSEGMSDRIYLEECIEQIVAFLNTTIQQYTTIGGAPSFTSPKKGGKSPKKINHSMAPSSFMGANKKLLNKMYIKWSELISHLVDLLNMRAGALTDTLVLTTTRVALGAFFLENISASSSAQSNNEIQLNALRLTSAIFAQYQSHRKILLQDILNSIAKVPTCKRGRVLYKVEGDDKSGTSISMFSALLLRIIQSSFLEENPRGEKTDDKESDSKEKTKNSDKSKDFKQEQSQILNRQYDSALKIAWGFLAAFLQKCCTSSSSAGASAEGDYKVIFENLVNDLMVTLYKPEWPAAHFLTKVLINIFINHVKIANKGEKGKGKGAGSEVSNTNMKLLSLEHLGTICARYAKELSSVDNTKIDVQTRLRNLLFGDEYVHSSHLADDSDNEKKNRQECSGDEGSDDDNQTPNKKTPNKFSKKKRKKKSTKKTADSLLDDVKLSKEMWKHLFRYCDEEKLSDEKNLHTASWIKELEREMEIQCKDDEDAKDSLRENLDNDVRKFLTLYRIASNPNPTEEEYHVIDSKTAEQIIRYIDISAPYTHRLFNVCLLHIISTLSATSLTNIRSRAMKALSTILNNAPKEKATSLLTRPDLQRAIRASLLDTSTSVRDSTIDLIGKYILNSQSEELIDHYYDILTERILDTGVSVRKKVIKILREICTTYPSYRRVPEICSKIIRRINDDGEGVRKLVTETFTSMWFKEDHDKDVINMKVKCINHVVATVITERIGTEWLHQLLTNLFNANPEGKSKNADDDDDNKNTTSAHQLQQVIIASSQIIDVLVSDVLCGSGPNSDDSSHKSTCYATMTTVWLFSKVCPQLLVNHISILQPYLSVRITSELDSLILVKAVQTIEHVLPKLTNPSESLMSEIEKSLTMNILLSPPQVLVVCVSCLSSVISKHTNNKSLAQDVFKKFYSLLDSLMKISTDHLNFSDPRNRPRLLRALYTCGLFVKHFDFLEEKQQLYHLFVRYVNMNMPSAANEYQIGDIDIILKALQGLGFMFERNPAFTLENQTKSVYKEVLSASNSVSENQQLRAYQEKTMVAVLENLTHYLSGELNAEISLTFDWSKENLKTMSSEDTEEGDPNSIQSSIIQTYLSDILKCTLCPLVTVRRTAVHLINIIHKGGIVHPLQLVPYLIAMSSDDDTSIRSRADHVLHEIERKYHGYVSMKSKQGVLLSFQLHSNSGRRGYRIENVLQSVNNSNQAANNNASFASEDQIITGRLATLYSVVASSRQSRRAFIEKLLSFLQSGQDFSTLFPYDSMSVGIVDLFEKFTTEHNMSSLQQYATDNIIWLPYTVMDEPLYILNQLEHNISLSGSHVQALFKDILNFQDDYEDEDEEGNPKYLSQSGTQSSSTPSSDFNTPIKSQNMSQITSNGHENGNKSDEDSDLSMLNISRVSYNTSMNNSLPSNPNETSYNNDASMASLQNDLSQTIQLPNNNNSNNNINNSINNFDATPTNNNNINNSESDNNNYTNNSTKNFISSGAVAELVKSLKEFYMLCWSKQMIRELYSITDTKFQDYSPIENQKVWDKQIHRRVIDVRILEKLMKYPVVNINSDDIPDEGSIRAEFRRFKNIQITGLDNASKNVAEIMKHPMAKEKKESYKERDREMRLERELYDANSSPVNNQGKNQPATYLPSDIPQEMKDKIIEQINLSDCQVRLVDISSMNADEMGMNSSPSNMDSESRSSLKMTISTSALNSHRIDKDKMKSSCKKKKKKHKRVSSP